METLKTEQQALKLGNIINLLMALCGILVFFYSNSKAILIDGLFSLIQFLSTFIAIILSKDLEISTNKKYPLGKYSKETLFVLFRSLLIIILIITSIFSGITTILKFLKNPESITQIYLSPILIYGIIMTLLCYSLLFMYKSYNKKIDNSSDILKAECMGANLDGFLSISTVIAFILFKQVPFLKPLLPISDAILVLLLSGFFAIQPIQLLITQINILSYKRIHPKLEKNLIQSVKNELPYLTIHDLFISKLGKFTEIYITLTLDGKHSVSELDYIRLKLRKIIDLKIKNSKSIIIFSNPKEQKEQEVT